MLIFLINYLDELCPYKSNFSFGKTPCLTKDRKFVVPILFRANQQKLMSPIDLKLYKKPQNTIFGLPLKILLALICIKVEIIGLLPKKQNFETILQ